MFGGADLGAWNAAADAFGQAQPVPEVRPHVEPPHFGFQEYNPEEPLPDQPLDVAPDHVDMNWLRRYGAQSNLDYAVQALRSNMPDVSPGLGYLGGQLVSAFSEFPFEALADQSAWRELALGYYVLSRPGLLEAVSNFFDRRKASQSPSDALVVAPRGKCPKLSI